mmetsp:Transcript_61386/g.146274  ORF Transcript_61386/g.146274 Transcript_61386/m.146274 type:complete len:158 (-) Transcript_61386:33-506(-)|eukprot:CAMPEP_0178414504 /NCGR_PEP_ID=MMETSP0689_2-20121128/23069_1 /TAXON_ID=160604 /ORGANISM="Amphidinium massartii, Strain CS-259" /LENGTH=157 /DNA_ID=CAMNT_0020035793 /DNA_START=44 /DNA_END=517 /DNA_ORIENTATION=-
MGNVSCCSGDQEEKSSDLVSGQYNPTRGTQEDKLSANFEPVGAAAAPAAAHVVLPAVKGSDDQGEFKQFSITIDKRAGGKHGVDVDCDESGSLVIAQIREGLFLNWNRDHPDKKVQVGDRIVSVNGQRGDVVDLVSECQRGMELVIEVHRGLEPAPV